MTASIRGVKTHYYHAHKGAKISLGSNLEIAKVRHAEIVARMKRDPQALNIYGHKNQWPEEILANAVSYSAKCGIYFLINNNTIVYVGQSIDLWQRIQQHKEKRAMMFDAVSWVACDVGKLNELELFYIDRLKPKYNIGHRPFNRRCLPFTKHQKFLLENQADS